MRGALVVAVALVACRTSGFADLTMGPRTAQLEEHMFVRAFANGLRVIVVPDARTNLVTVGVHYDVGGADDPPAAPGLAHYAEHVLYEAAFARNGEALREAALDANAVTRLDRTYFHASALDSELEHLLEAAARRFEVGCADFDADLLARERDVVIEEARMHASSDVRARFAAALWGEAHPYAHGPGGTGFATVARDELCAFVGAHYGPASAVLVVTGNVGAGTVERIRARFEPIAARPQVSRALRAPAPATGTTRTVVAGLREPTLMLVFPVPGEGSEHDAEIDLLDGATWQFRDDDTWRTARAAVLGERRDRVVTVAVSVADAKELDEVEAALRAVLAKPALASFAALRERRRMDLVTDLEDVQAIGYRLSALAAWRQHVSRFRTFRQLDTLDAVAVARWVDPRRARTLVLLPEVGTPATVGADALVTSLHRLDVLRGPAAELPAVPARARPRIVDYRLDNGLRVLLAPDRDSIAIDARLVIDTGVLGGRWNQLSTQAAFLLRPTDGDGDERVSWYRTIGVPVIPTFEGTSTTFGVRGFALFGDWHVWNLAWTVLHGAYPQIDGTRDKLRGRTALAIALERLIGATDRELVLHSTPRLDAFRRSAYRPERATLIVAGKFDELAMRREIEQLFAAWRAADSRAADATEGEAPASSHVVMSAESEPTVELALVFPASRATPADRTAREALVEVLAERMRVVREGLGVSYGIQASGRTNGFVVSGFVGAAHAAVAAKAIAAELARIRAWDATVADDFARARRRLLMRALARPAGASNLAEALERIAIDGTPIAQLDHGVAAIRALSTADVQRFAALLAPTSAIVVARGPSAAAESAVRELGGTRIETLR